MNKCIGCGEEIFSPPNDDDTVDYKCLCELMEVLCQGQVHFCRNEVCVEAGKDTINSIMEKLGQIKNNHFYPDSIYKYDKFFP